MQTVGAIIKFLPQYVSKIIAIWIVWIWFFLLDGLGLVVDAFIPGFSPPQWVYWGLIPIIAFVVANVKLFFDYEQELSIFEQRLSVYEQQAPNYRLNLIEAESKLCSGEVHIDCSFSVSSTNPWPGNLVDFVINNENPPAGLKEWELQRKDYETGRGFDDILKLPFKIPQKGVNLNLVFHAEIVGPMEVLQETAQQNLIIPIQLMVEYSVPPSGFSRKLFPLDIPVSIENVLRDLAARD